MATFRQQMNNRPLLKTTHKTFENFPLYPNTIRYNPSKTYNGIVSNIVDNNPLNEKFFSQDNMKRLQKLIKYNVYIKSDKKVLIDEQSEDELLLLMRSVYLENSRNSYHDMDQQIKDLNMIVLTEAVPIILSNVEMHRSYLYEIGQPKFMRPIARPINVNFAGTNTLIGSSSRIL